MDSIMIILQGKQKEISSFLINILKECAPFENQNRVDFRNKEERIQKNFLTFNGHSFSLIETESGIDPFDERPTLRLGSTGIYVIELQNILTKLLYYTESVDGGFGIATENAVKRFQTNNRLTVDGVVGRDTWSALSSLYSPLAICEENPKEDYFLYTVVSGDSLFQIARRFGTTVNAIKSLNGLTSDFLKIGQILKIPRASNNPDYILYTVVSGDSLFQIARRFGTTVNAIKSLNGLTSDFLKIGQILKIPRVSNNPDYILYTVVSGDTIFMGNNE